MWTIISVAVPVVLAIYGLARLQHIRSSHGAQGPTCSTYTPARFYNSENPDLRRQANTLQSAEERDAEAHKYLVKWDSDEELEPSSNVVPLLDSALTLQDVGEKKQSGKHKQADVKWDEFEEK
jgi:hypothetical protein